MTFQDINGGYKARIFYGHNEMEAFVKNSQIDASPTQLTKKGNSRGYTIIKSNMQTENCNDYPKGVQRR